MPSDLIVPVVVLTNVRPHPNADRLDLVDVLGYQMCVGRGSYKEGDVGVYFPADTLLPPEVVERYGLLNYMKGADKNRVGRIKLRGEPSFGVVVPIPEGVSGWQIGDDVGYYFGARKYEPPPPPFRMGNMAAYDSEIDPLFPVYTKINNGRIYTSIFQPGEPIVLTEKVHGSNSRVAMIKHNYVAGTHHTRRSRPTRTVVISDGVEEREEKIEVELTDDEIRRDVYWHPWSIESVRRFIEEKAKDHESVVVYGEVFGRRIQSLDYGIAKMDDDLGYRVFDILIDGVFLSWPEKLELAKEFGFPVVPILEYAMPFDTAKVLAMSDGPSTVEGAKHIREGVVATPLQERTHPQIGRVILKYIGTEYELWRDKKGASDYTDA